MRRFALCLSVLLILAAHRSQAQEGSRAGAQRTAASAAQTVAAANSQAVSALYSEISALRLAPGLSVHQFIDKLDAREELMSTLALADQIGGPRWLNENTVQVRLEIPSTRVVTALERIAVARPRFSPIAPEQVRRAAADWPRKFAANGSSTSARHIASLGPPVHHRWDPVDDRARQAALASAKDAAIRRTMDSVSRVRLAEGKTLADAFAQPEIGEPIRRWLMERPATQVDFREQDLSVEVNLAVEHGDFYERLRSILVESKVMPLPQNDRDWRLFEREFHNAFRPAVGRASADIKPPPANTARLPDRAPDWIERSINARGTAPLQSSVLGAQAKLRATAQAERDARLQLRRKIEALALRESTTLGDAARQDQRIERAIDRAVDQADFSTVRLVPGEAAAAELSLDLRLLWDELQR